LIGWRSLGKHGFPLSRSDFLKSEGTKSAR
jgi:hypothetical protein